MKKIILIFFVALVPLLVAAQSAINFSKVWVNGSGISYFSTFNASSITNVWLDTFLSPVFSQGNSNICDSMGNLLYCSDGYNIYDEKTNYIEGGDTMVYPELYKIEGGWSVYDQSSIMLPMDSGKYYFVTPAATDSFVLKNWSGGYALFDVMLYAIIDKNANGGQGKVVSKRNVIKPNQLMGKVQMMACKAGDGKSWWVFKHAATGNTVIKLLFTQDSVYGPYYQSFSAPDFTGWDQEGQSAFTRDGTHFASVRKTVSKLFYADFDRCTGSLSNPQSYDVPLAKTHSPFDTTEMEYFTNTVAFSPNGRFIYIGKRFNIQQFDTQDQTWVTVGGLDTAWNYFQQYSSMYLGNDNKLYIGNWNGFSDAMSVINNPNVKGMACGFCPRCLVFPRFTNNGQTWTGVETPPCMPNYALGAANPPCTVGVQEWSLQQKIFKIFPNPTTGIIQLQYRLQPNQKGSVEITNVLGKIIKTVILSGTSGTSATSASSVTAATAETDLNAYPNGIYYYQYVVDGQMYQAGKIVLNK